jgi:predicted nucleic acid-binding protein
MCCLHRLTPGNAPQARNRFANKFALSSTHHSAGITTEEEQATLQFLELFETAAVNREIIDLAGRYFREFRSSNGIDINDAILAATCALTGGRIYTLNKKHYPMRDIVVEKAW